MENTLESERRRKAREAGAEMRQRETERRALGVQMRRLKAAMLLLEPAAKSHGPDSRASRKWLEAMGRYTDALRAWRAYGY